MRTHARSTKLDGVQYKAKRIFGYFDRLRHNLMRTSLMRNNGFYAIRIVVVAVAVAGARVHYDEFIYISVWISISLRLKLGTNAISRYQSLTPFVLINSFNHSHSFILFCSENLWKYDFWFWLENKITKIHHCQSEQQRCYTMEISSLVSRLENDDANVEVMWGVNKKNDGILCVRVRVNGVVANNWTQVQSTIV